jgi:hypothetical protein
MDPPDPVSELYAGSYRRLVVQLYAVTGGPRRPESRR